MGDDRLGRTEPGGDRVECAAQLDAVGAPAAGRPGVGVAVGGAVEEDHPVPGRDERVDEGRELAATTSPAVHEVDDRPGPPDMAVHSGALGEHRERLAARGERRRGHRRRHREPQVAGAPPGELGRDPVADPEGGPEGMILKTNDRAFLQP
nr:hypothetical protein [Nocardioides sp.]